MFVGFVGEIINKEKHEAVMKQLLAGFKEKPVCIEADNVWVYHSCPDRCKENKTEGFVGTYDLFEEIDGIAPSGCSIDQDRLLLVSNEEEALHIIDTRKQATSVRTPFGPVYFATDCKLMQSIREFGEASPVIISFPKNQMWLFEDCAKSVKKFKIDIQEDKDESEKDEDYGMSGDFWKQ